MLKRYGFFGVIRLFISFIYTKVVYPQARLIRLPFDIRNSHNISIGRNFTTGFGCRIEAHPQVDKNNKNIIIGENVEINDYVHIAAAEKIEIGNDVLIASKVFISDLNHGNYSGTNVDSPFTTPNSRKLSSKPVIIKDNVWIGEGVCIMSGVTIGYGSIIGASSVVTKDIPDLSIAVGAPARVIKKFDVSSNKWISLSNK